MRVDLSQPNHVPFIVRLVYLINRILPSKDPESRFGVLLDLEWVLSRLCHEYSRKVIAPAEQAHTGEAITFLSTRINREHSVLDIGCGSGEIAAGVTQLAAEVVGIDLSEESIAVARNEYRLEGLRFEVSDVFDHLTAGAPSVDVVILSHVLEHVDVPDILLAEIAKKCRFLYLEVPDFDHSALNRHREYLGLALIYQDPDHRYEFDRSDVRTLLDQNSFRIIDHEFRYGVQRYWCESVPDHDAGPQGSASAACPLHRYSS